MFPDEEEAEILSLLIAIAHLSVKLRYAKSQHYLVTMSVFTRLIDWSQRKLQQSCIDLYYTYKDIHKVVGH